ncbi:MAG: hypothetical protein L3J56_13380, partial [Bacteroidales bacterium]|nr:hypothetical protein [Bacteroidales bacterium]
NAFWPLMKQNFIYTLTVCTRKDLLFNLIKRIIDENLTYPYDYWFWLHISINSKIKILDSPTACYRIHNNGISRKAGFFDTNRVLVKVDLIKAYLRLKNVKLNREQKKIIYHIAISLLKNKKINRKIKISFLFFIIRRVKQLIQTK